MFGKRTEEPLTLERKLEILAECGMGLAHPFTALDLLESWPREEFEKPGFDLTLVGLGMTEERPPWRNHSVSVWHFDTECIEGNGSYVRIAERMAELTQGSLIIENPRDQVDATGSNDDWNFSIGWSSGNQGPRPPNASQAGEAVPQAAEPTGLTSYEAVEKLTGLKLVKQKRSIPVLVVDHVDEKPLE